MSSSWTRFAIAKPTHSMYIWIAREGREGHLAYWSQERTAKYSLDVVPGIAWCQPWQGIDQPTHWMPAQIPEAPQSVDAHTTATTTPARARSSANCQPPD